ncbi:type IV pilus modification PilV family protein [Sporosarcina aquimarina]|uniref:type IV pilus modification PilV family protein n=1 Tax=Sporosarcina aquimarina TaxID=114975 RepID=UPI00295F4C23|nr:prepilin-type N-terminal cleavage/methylation domain-containing protein [Sporosarcina aquimarina]
MFKFKWDSGMSLVEILASIVILGIVIVSFMSIFSQSALHNKSTDQIINGSNYASELMENFVLMSHKGSPLESVHNFLVNEKHFRKISKLHFLGETSEEKIDVEFILENPAGYENYKVTRVIIQTVNDNTGTKNTIAESLLYWRSDNE